MKRFAAFILALYICFGLVGAMQVKADTEGGTSILSDQRMVKAGGTEVYAFTLPLSAPAGFTFIMQEPAKLDVDIIDSAKNKSVLVETKVSADWKTLRELGYDKDLGELLDWYGVNVYMYTPSAGSYILKVGTPELKKDALMVVTGTQSTTIVPPVEEPAVTKAPTVTKNPGLSITGTSQVEESSIGDDSDPAKKGISVVAGFTYKLNVRSNGGKLTYRSNNKKVAAVSKTGKITGKKAGKAVITVTDAKGSKTSCVITVVKNEFKKPRINPKKLHSGTRLLAVYKAKYDKKGNLLVYMDYVNNYGRKVIKIKRLYCKVFNSNGAKLGTGYVKNQECNITSPGRASIKVKISKSKLKGKGKKPFNLAGCKFDMDCKTDMKKMSIFS